MYRDGGPVVVVSVQLHDDAVLRMPVGRPVHRPGTDKCSVRAVRQVAVFRVLRVVRRRVAQMAGCDGRIRPTVRAARRVRADHGRGTSDARTARRGGGRHVPGRHRAGERDPGVHAVQLGQPEQHNNRVLHGDVRAEHQRLHAGDAVRRAVPRRARQVRQDQPAPGGHRI